MSNQRIQNSDVKGQAQVPTKADLIHDSKIYVTANSINKRLDEAITDGDIGSGGGGAPNANSIINGNFDFWQRGISFTTTGPSSDRFVVSSTGSTHVVTRQNFTVGQTDVPNNPTHFYRQVVTSSAGAGNFSVVRHAVEDVRSFAGETVTLSFWAKADSNKNISIEFFQNFGSGGFPDPLVQEIGVQKFAITSSWQKITHTVSIPSIAGKTLGTNGNSYLAFLIWFDAGSSFNSRTDSLGHQSGTFDIAQVKLEEGSFATDFVLAGGNIEGELSACQRYYEKSYSINTAPGSITQLGSVVSLAVSTSLLYLTQGRFITPKRAAPTIRYYSPATGNIDRWRNDNTVSDLTTNTNGLIINDNSLLHFQNAILTVGQQYAFHWTADAEL
jgi:hypothetical protein